MGKRDERDLERGLLGGDEVPDGKGALESCAGMAPEVTHIRSHMTIGFVSGGSSTLAPRRQGSGGTYTG